MKRKILIYVVLVLTLSLFTFAEKKLSNRELEGKYLKEIAVINDLFYKPQLVVDDSRIYIYDIISRKVYIYSKKDGSRLAVFGGKGEGPGEFMMISDIHCHKDLLYVCNPPKLSLFTTDGKHVRDVRNIFNGRAYFPFGENIIGKQYRYDYTNSNNSVSLVFALLDTKLNYKKDIYEAKYTEIVCKDKRKSPYQIYHHCRKGIVYKDRFYVGDTGRGFFLSVFDLSGKKLFDLSRDYEKIQISDSLKKGIVDRIKKAYPELFPKFLNRKEFVFPEYIPAYVNFFLHDDKIFFFKYSKPGTGGIVRLVLLELNGNLLKNIDIQLPGLNTILTSKGEISFHNGKLNILVGEEEGFKIMELCIDDFLK